LAAASDHVLLAKLEGFRSQPRNLACTPRPSVLTPYPASKSTTSSNPHLEFENQESISGLDFFVEFHMSGCNILVCGAGVAGPVVAFFLTQAGARVTIVEKAPSLRTGGQNVDVRGLGLKVLRFMGVEDAVHDRMTQEEGVAFVNAANRHMAQFPVDKSGRNLSMTAEIEIMRGDLAEVLYSATKNDIKYQFDDSVESLEEQDDKVQVHFKSGSNEEFDLVVAADGLGSHTRKVIFGETQMPGISSLGQYVSWFSIPRAEGDGVWARWYNAPGRRLILLRPNTGGTSTAITRASMWICSTSAKLEKYSKLSVQEQKNLMHELFDDAGWETSRVLDGMDSAEDFYMQEVAQVRMESWSHGRTCLLGDAAFCPSPISGMGTTLAIVGAYLLAGEIMNNPRDYSTAFASYEKIMRPFVSKGQKLIPGAPQIANPQTGWGISLLHLILGFISWSGVDMIVAKFAGAPVDGIALPDYDFRTRAQR
jgi:2-polyprenyl-6-methoxyphenol hydroxylase-like FAD-dependent oxidoreductase